MDKAVKKTKTRGDKRSEGASRVRKHRAKMKAAGLKPVTLWLPDTTTPEFREQIRRECELINASADEKVILDQLSNIEIDGWK